MDARWRQLWKMKSGGNLSWNKAIWWIFWTGKDFNVIKMIPAPTWRNQLEPLMELNWIHERLSCVLRSQGAFNDLPISHQTWSAFSQKTFRSQSGINRKAAIWETCVVLLEEAKILLILHPAVYLVAAVLHKSPSSTSSFKFLRLWFFKENWERPSYLQRLLKVGWFFLFPGSQDWSKMPPNGGRRGLRCLCTLKFPSLPLTELVVCSHNLPHFHKI